MLRRNALSLSLLLGLILFGMTSVSAQELRLPATGNPAFILTLPVGWKSLIDEWGNLRLTHESLTALVQLSMLTGDLAHAPFPVLAAGILHRAGPMPYSMSSPGSIAGTAGQSFQSQITNPSGVTLDVLVTLARLDQGHIAGLVTMKAVGLSSETLTAVDDVVARVSFTGVQ